MKILIIRLSSFGDQIHLCPAIRDLKRQRPNVEIHWLVQSEFASVPKAHHSVSRVVSLPLAALRKNPWSLAAWRDLIRVIKNLKNEDYQLAIDAQGVIKSALMAFFSGARLRVGYGREGLAERLAYWFYHRHFLYEPGMSSVTKLRHFFCWAFDLGPITAEVDFGLPKWASDAIDDPSRVLFIPFASHENKMLPLGVWIELARVLRSKHADSKILISWGSERERELADAMEAQSGGLMQSNPYRLEFSALVNSLLRCRLVVGVDTGVSQLANALGIPTVMIFKKSAPQIFFTEGSPYSLQLGSANVAPTQKELEEAVLTALSRIVVP